MSIKKSRRVRGGIDAPDADHRCTFISTNGKTLSGKFEAFKDSATADAEGETIDDNVVVNIKRKDMTPKVKAAIRVLREALEDAAVAEAGVEEVLEVFEVEAVAADAEAGIEAVAAVEAVKSVRGRAAGKLFGGSVVRSES